MAQGDTTVFENPHHIEPCLTDKEVCQLPAIDMAQGTFNKDYSAASPLIASLQGAVENVTTKFDLPGLAIVGGWEHSKPLSGEAVKEAPPELGAKSPGSGVLGQSVLSKDLFTFTHKQNQDGGYTDQQFGPRPEDNYVITKAADGQFFVTARPGEQPVQLESWVHSDIRLKRAELREMADEHIKDPAERAAFAQNMAKFEKRIEQLEDIYQKEGLSSADAAKQAREEVAKTYFRISSLLNTKDNPDSPLHEQDRVLIARQILSHAADPTSIDQGAHLTCNVTTIESRTYTRHPADAANLVASVAGHGFYFAKDNTRVKLDKDSMTPDSEAASKLTHVDGQRDFASQLFQVTAANIWYQKHDPSVHYEQTKDGERLSRYGANGQREDVTSRTWGEWFRGKAANPVKDPDLYDDALVEVGNAITGSNSNDWFFEHIQGSRKNTVHIESEQDLEDKLADAKAHGRLPIVIAVHTGNEPFLTDKGDGASGGAGGPSGGWHVVCVTDFEPGAPAKVAIDNQWGSGADHFGDRKITARQLYLAMRKPDDAGQLREFRQFVKDDDCHLRGTISDALELLRLERQAGYFDNSYLVRHLTPLIQMCARDFKQSEKDGKVDPDALAQRLNKLREVVSFLPADKRMEMISRIHNSYISFALDQNDFAGGNEILGDWAAQEYHQAWAKHKDDLRHGLSDTDEIDSMVRLQAAYERIAGHMPAKVVEHMVEVLRK